MEILEKGNYCSPIRSDLPNMTLLDHIHLSVELVKNAGKLVRWKTRETVTGANAGKYVTNGNGTNLQKNPSKKGSENETV